MDREFDKACKICEILNNSSGDQVIVELCSWINSSVNANHIPTIAIVSVEKSLNDLYCIAEKFLEIEFDEIPLLSVQDNPVCITFMYGEESCFSFSENGDDLRVTYGSCFVDSERLKEMNLMLCSGLPKDVWLELSSEIDAVCLETNATMAMTNSERTWVKDVAVPLFGSSAVYLGIEKLDKLNSNKDRSDLRANVGNTCSRIGITNAISEGCLEAIELILPSLELQSITKKRQTRILRNGVTAIKERLDVLVDESKINDEDILATKDALKSRKATLALNGDFISEVIIKNTISELKSEVVASTEDYGREIVDNIRMNLESTSDVDIYKVIEKIPEYIESAWRYFLTESGKLFDKKLELLYKDITQQIEKDLAELISTMNPKEIKVLYEALGLQMSGFDMSSNFGMDRSISNPETTTLDVEARYEQMRENVGRETRNLMILSLPLLFVNPLYSIGIVIGANTLQKIKQKDQHKEQRAVLQSEIETLCESCRLQVVDTVVSSSEEMTKSSIEGVKQTYDGFIDMMNQHIESLEGNLKEAETYRHQWAIIAKDDIPVLLELLG